MADRIQLLTLNLLTRMSADGPARHRAVKRVLLDLQPDVVALQEVTRNENIDQAADLLDVDYSIIDLPGGDPVYGGECIATRLPVVRVTRLDQPIESVATAKTEARASAIAVELIGPGSMGSILVVHHKGTYELNAEYIREQQALATARFVEDLIGDHPSLPVTLLGDFNAAPDHASIRFLTGRQSLGGLSVRYEDVWEALHSDQPGHTFEPRNPLVRAGQMPLERGRRIDYVMIRSGRHGPLLNVVSCRRVLTTPIDGIWGSDHYGLLADLQLPPHPPGQWAPNGSGAQSQQDQSL